MSTLKLQSNDGEVFEVDMKVAQMSVTIKTMLEDLGFSEDEDPIPLPNVSGEVLKKVFEWCKYHKDDVEPPKEDEEEEDMFKEKRTDDICYWDTEFFKVEQSMIFEIILAANYLDIKGLLLVGCKTVAGMLKGKTPEEIRKTFNIVNDLTPEEMEQIRKENAWTDEKE